MVNIDDNPNFKSNAVMGDINLKFNPHNFIKPKVGLLKIDKNSQKYPLYKTISTFLHLYL